MQDIVLAGCGAVGSRLALELAAPGLSFLLIDDDRVDGNNVRTGSTIFWSQHIGVYKVWALGEMLARRFGCVSHAFNETLTRSKVQQFGLFRGARVIVDGFDNVEARQMLVDLQALPEYGQAIPPVVHVGVSPHGTGLVAWGDKYELPEEAPARGVNPVCTHALGRDIITWTSTVAAIIIRQYLETGRQRSVITTKGLSVIDLG